MFFFISFFFCISVFLSREDPNTSEFESPYCTIAHLYKFPKVNRFGPVIQRRGDVNPLAMRRNERRVKLLEHDGRLPCNEVAWSVSSRSAVNLHSSVGIVPVTCLLNSTASFFRAVSLPSSEGSFESNSLFLSKSDVSFVSCPISVGIVPFKFCFHRLNSTSEVRDRLVMVWVADQFQISRCSR